MKTDTDEKDDKRKDNNKVSSKNEKMARLRN
jgi:hypothetical protein